jgi:hypothetical protein
VTRMLTKFFERDRDHQFPQLPPNEGNNQTQGFLSTFNKMPQKFLAILNHTHHKTSRSQGPRKIRAKRPGDSPPSYKQRKRKIQSQILEFKADTKPEKCSTEKSREKSSKANTNLKLNG